MNQDRTLTTAEAAKILGVAQRTVLRYITESRLAASETPGGHYRLSYEDVEAFRQSLDRQQESQARIICFTNQKGGVGKTTLTVNMGVLLSQYDRRVLIVDLDPQGHATFSLGSNPDTNEYTVYDAMMDGGHRDYGRLIKKTRFGPDLAPINMGASEADLELSTLPTWGLCLEKVLEPVRQQYDYILIDTAPHFDKLLVNALLAADYVVIPTQLEMLSVRGLQLLRGRIVDARRTNHILQIAGVVPMMVQDVIADQSMASQLRHALGDQIRIFRNSVLRSAAFKDVSMDHNIMANKHPRGEHTMRVKAVLGELLRVIGDPLAERVEAEVEAFKPGSVKTRGATGEQLALTSVSN